MRTALSRFTVGAALLGSSMPMLSHAETFSDINQPGPTSITLYGVLDTNLEYVNHADASGESVFRENSGGLSNNRFGVRGREDLGGGLAAFFALEAGFNANDGTMVTSGTEFNRTAEVGLASRYGAVSAGLQYTAMYDILEHFDPMSYSPQYTWLPTTGSSQDMAFKARLNNSLKYVGHFGNWMAIADYSLGGDPTSFQSSAAYGAGLEYDFNTFSAALAYDYRNGAINTAGKYSRTSNWSATARQGIGPFTLLGGYEHYLSEPTKGANAVSDLWFGGVRFPVGPRVSLTLATYYQDDHQPGVSNSLMGVVSGQYHLSPHTDLYATLAYASATQNATGATPVGVTSDTAFWSNQTAATVGIRHRF